MLHFGLSKRKQDNTTGQKIISNIDICQVLYATDSNGRVCGNGYLKDRKYLLFFDLTRCLNPAVLAHGCLTPQVTFIENLATH